MKESNTLVGNAENNFHQKEKLLDIIGEYMKESNTLAVNAANNFLREILVDTKGLYIIANKYQT